MEHFSGSADSKQLFKITKYHFCNICDSDEDEPELGTGFLFLKDNWIVTAAHVVMNHGLPRKNLYGGFSQTHEIINLKVIAIHKESDLAILEITDETYPCRLPLYPAHENFSTGKGLVYIGYIPSQKAFNIELVTSFSRYSRERDQTEIIIEFEGGKIDGGSSGGPIFGDGGGVLGVLINIFSNEREPEKKFARAVSIQSLMSAVNIELNPGVLQIFSDTPEPAE